MEPQFAEQRDTATSHSPPRAATASPASSLPNFPSEKAPDNSPTGAGGLLPSPVPGPARPHSTIIPAHEYARHQSKKSSHNGSLPKMPGDGRPFFVSPLPRTIKLKKAVLNKKPSAVAVQAFQVQSQATSKSDATGVEYEHELHMAEKRRRAEFRRRLFTAIVGGIFVIVPMVIMCKHRSLNKSLITSSVAVLLFGITLAWSSTSDDTSLFIATAGYAAFLAVFVAVGDDSIGE